MARPAPAGNGSPCSAVVSLIAPVALLIESLAGKPVDAAAVAGVAGVMFLLVVLRMSGAGPGAPAGGDPGAGPAARGAPSWWGRPGRHGIHHATISAVSELVGSQAEVCSIGLAMARTARRFFGCRRPRARSTAAQIVDLGTLPLAAKERLAAGQAVRCTAPDPEGLCSQDGVSHLFVCPLVTARS